MGGAKYIIFAVITFVSLGLFWGIYEWRKRLRKIKVRKKDLRKASKFLIVILILALIGLGFWGVRYYRNMKLCRDKCKPFIEGWRFSDPDIPLIKMNFDTQKECIDFCSSILEDIQEEEWRSIDLKSIY